MTRRSRTVQGPTDRVVVVGAGLAGLSAAMHLAAAGRDVVVLEQEQVPGGRAGLLELAAPDGSGTYRFDTGPTVLTMPGLIDDCFAALGEDRADWLDLLPVDPVYRGIFTDGTQLDVHADPEAMAQEVRQVCGPTEAAGYERFVRFVSRLYRYQMRDFIDRNLDSPLDVLTPNLARLVAAGGMGRLAPTVARYLHDPRMQRLFSFQSLYAGVGPQQALALYAVISYMDTVAGVVFPRGGMHALPSAMAEAAAKHGVDLRYGTRVTGLDLAGDRVTGVRTSDGERLVADAVVLTPDLPIAYQELLGGQTRRLRRLRYSPSCYLWLAGVRRSAGPIDELGPHHSVYFGTGWDRTFDELGAGLLMSDPSVLVSRPTVSDPSLAPEGADIAYVLAPTPHLAVPDPLDWDRVGPAYQEHLRTTLHDRGCRLLDGTIEVQDVTTPQDWAARGMAAGTPFAAAHTFAQTGPLRPANRWGQNVVLAGSGTQPGVGVPMVLVSGRLAAERITGHDPAYRSRTWP